MTAARSDLTAEEWEALNRLSRGRPESQLVPGTIFDRLAELGLGSERGGQRRISRAGKLLILKHKEDIRQT